MTASRDHDLGDGVVAHIDTKTKTIWICGPGRDEAVAVPLEALIYLLLKYLRALHAALDPNKVDF